MKKILSYLLVGILVIVFCYLFVRVFSFEKENTEEEIKVSREIVDKIYTYLPEDYDLNRSSMYSRFYMTFNNISLDSVLTAVYKYICNYEPLNLLYLSQEDLVAQKNNERYKALYKIDIEEFNKVFKIMFGSEVSIINKDFYINYNTRALFITDVGYYIYEVEDEVEKSNYEIHKAFSRYVVTDSGNTIKIYDRYTKCDKINNICYDDDRNKYKNNVLYNNGEFTNFDSVQEYVHLYKLENGNYYWHSSELAE